MNLQQTDRCKQFSIARVVDAAKGYGAVNTQISALEPNSCACGRAVTVWTLPGKEAWLDEVLSLVQAGDVVVIDACGEEFVASLSPHACQRLNEKGVVGAVVNGAVAQYAQVGFPVFARCVHPGMTHMASEYRVGVAVVIADVAVQTGDLIYGTDDGIVVIPHSDIESTLRAAQKNA